MATEESERALIEGVLARPVTDATQAAWGFQNRTDLDADPAWVIFDVLPGVPVPEAGDAGLEGPRFPAIALAMGELLARLRRLPTAGLELDDRWADPGRLAAEAGRWVQGLTWLADPERAAVLESAWPPFLRGAGIDATDPELPVRARCLQVLRMVELLAGETSLAPEVRGIVADRLRAMLR